MVALFKPLTVPAASPGFDKKIAAFKAGFFDRPAVERKADAATRRVLSRMGAFVRRRAQSSIKTKRGPSAPGSPPHAHRSYESDPRKDRTGKSRTRYFFRDSILFALDPSGPSVVVGPFLFNKSPTNPAVPQLHEFGGTLAGNGRVTWIANKPGRNAQGRFVTAGKTRVVLTGAVRYPARPYMRPALLAERGKFAGLFRDQVR